MVAELSIFHRLFCLRRPRLRSYPTPSNPDPMPSDPPVIPDDVIKEILKLLPVKSLMRFKCVSKNWLSIITKPSFTRAYPGGFRGIAAFWHINMHRAQDIHYLGIDDTGPTPTCEAYHHSTVDFGGQELGHTAVVNGLICLFDDSGKSWLYNIATRERVQLPPSSVPVPTDDKAQKLYRSCRLGFDPVSRLYKLVMLSMTFDQDAGGGDELPPPASVYFEILTIGVDSCWRMIDTPPLPSLGSLAYPGISVDGVVYGLEFMWHHCHHRVLTAFHVAEERFLSVPLPEDFDHPPTNDNDADNFRFCTLKLLWFFPGPGPVLIHNRRRREANVRIDRYSYDGDSGGAWHREILTLPHGNLVPKGILPNGKVLIADLWDPNVSPRRSGTVNFLNYRGSKPARLFLYDPVKRRLEELVMINWDGPNKDGPNTTAALAKGDYFYMEENIVSLKCLTSCCSN